MLHVSIFVRWSWLLKRLTLFSSPTDQCELPEIFPFESQKSRTFCPIFHFYCVLVISEFNPSNHITSYRQDIRKEKSFTFGLLNNLDLSHLHSLVTDGNFGGMGFETFQSFDTKLPCQVQRCFLNAAINRGAHMRHIYFSQTIRFSAGH